MRPKHKARVLAAKKLADGLPYTSYPIGEPEYIGKYTGSLREFITEVRERGYNYQIFAARKSVSGKYDDGSYAQIAQDHPPEAAGTRLIELNPRECQYHIHPFIRDSGVDIYGHYEIHPNPFIPDFDLQRPWPRHYRPTKKDDDTPWDEVTYIKGVCDPKLTEIIDNDTK